MMFNNEKIKRRLEQIEKELKICSKQLDVLDLTILSLTTSIQDSSITLKELLEELDENLKTTNK